MINVGGLIGKLEKNADYVAAALCVYDRFKGDVGQIFRHFTSKDFLDELQASITSLDQLKYKLLESPNLYTGVFKMSAIGYLLAEAGLINAKYKRLAQKLMWGSGLVALTTPGSGPNPPTYSGSSGYPNSNTYQGYSY